MEIQEALGSNAATTNRNLSDSEAEIIRDSNGVREIEKLEDVEEELIDYDSEWSEVEHMIGGNDPDSNSNSDDFLNDEIQ